MKARWLTTLGVSGVLLGGVLFVGGCSAPSAAPAPGHPLAAQIQRGLEGGTDRFDHGGLDRLLGAHVDTEGRVDYSGLAAERALLQDYLRALAEADLSRLGREELLALLINAYNAFTLDWVVENLPLVSIRETSEPWTGERHRLGGSTVSLDFIEHSLLRVPELFDEPRIHFAVNCASRGCPPLSAKAFVGGRIREQLAGATTRALAREDQLRVEGDRVRVTRLLDWFASDFERDGGTRAGFLARYAPPPARALLEAQGDRVLSFLEYDWSLNGTD